MSEVISEKPSCEKCKFSRRLKHNFKEGVGFELDYCCVVWEYLSDQKNEPLEKTMVIQVSKEDCCELFYSR